jgi:hypothetical protein
MDQKCISPYFIIPYLFTPSFFPFGALRHYGQRKFFTPCSLSSFFPLNVGPYPQAQLYWARQTMGWMADCRYKFNRSLELSLLPYVEMYRSSTFFLCPTTHDSDRFGWIMVAGGVISYRRSRRWYDPTKHTSPNYRPWVMLTTYSFV